MSLGQTNQKKEQRVTVESITQSNNERTRLTEKTKKKKKKKVDNLDALYRFP